jgi:RsiW-degrading membrane proteinase PrsW (M82 family)
MTLPDPDKTRRTVGLWLFIASVLICSLLLVLEFLLPPLFMPNPKESVIAMLVGGLLAFPAAIMYLTVPRLLDRYDPEPWYALVGCLLWGGIVSSSIAGLVNSVAAGIGVAIGGPGAADVMSAVISAPITEEFLKCVGVWGVFYFLRREFDGVVDGIIYATFVALGFATVENVLYYAQAAQQGQEVLTQTFVLRGVLSPWVHPVFTSMFGIGIGMTREARSAWVQWIAPLLGYGGAVFLHFVWNGSATFGGAILWVLLLPLWFVFVLAFLIMIVVLVRRRGRIIRENLLDEVALGTIDQQELELVCSAFGLVKAHMRHGEAGADFVRATARLALSKWHTARAMETQQRTISMEFIIPLRQHISQLRAALE